MLLWLQRQFNKNIYLIMATILCLLIVLRNPIPLFRPELWAEDGSIFFADMFYYGSIAVFYPVWSSFHLLSRLIALFASFSPTFYIATIYAWVSLCAYISVLLYFLRDSFSWIIPSRKLRIVFILLMATGLGSWEVQANICNLMYVLAFFMALLSLEKPLKVTTPYLILWIFLSFSTPVFFVFIPYHFGYWLVTKDKSHLKIFLALLPAFLISLISLIFHTWDYVSPASLQTFTSHITPIPLFELPNLIFMHFIFSTFYIPLFGQSFFERIIQLNLPFYIFYFIMVLFFVSYCIKKNIYIGLLYLGLCMSITFAMQCLTRDYGYSIWLAEKTAGIIDWNSRHAFLLGALATMFWLAWCNRVYTFYSKFLGVLLGLVIICNVVYYTNTSLPSRKDIHWPAYASYFDTLRTNLRNEKIKLVYETPPIPLQPEYYYQDLKLHVRYSF